MKVYFIIYCDRCCYLSICFRTNGGLCIIIEVDMNMRDLPSSLITLILCVFPTLFASSECHHLHHNCVFMCL